MMNVEFNMTDVIDVEQNATLNSTLNSTIKYCEEWPGAQLQLFQVGNAFQLVAFLVPHNMKASALLMRSMLCVGQTMFMLWAAINICAADIFAWYAVMVIINMSHMIYVAVKIWPPLIPSVLKDLYVKLFLPLKVNRRQFRTLLKEAEIKFLEAGDYFAVEENTPSDQRLSILLSGKIRVTCDSAHLHYVFANQFIDSPEWEAAEKGNSDNLFQVSLLAVEKCRYVTWSRPLLLQLLDNKPFLRDVIRCLVGKDITMKLYSLNEQKVKEEPTIEVNPLHRSRSADTVHMGSSGFVRSDVWIAHKTLSEGEPEPLDGESSKATKKLIEVKK